MFVEVPWIDPDMQQSNRLCSVSEPEKIFTCPFSACGVRGERELAASDQDNARGPGVRLRHERDALRKTNLKILSREREIPDGEPCWDSIETVETSDGCEHCERCDAPRVGFTRIATKVDQPRAHPSFDLAELDEHVDVYVCASPAGTSCVGRRSRS